ncbi:DUF7684 family protein [Hahella chejuensis]|nr:hypothetical protein [Hahella chejuensis]
MKIEYLNIKPNAENLSVLSSEPFRAIVVVEEPVSPEWRHNLSRSLVKAGCLYMMAWGIEASSWDDSVDHANLEAFSYGDIPKEKCVMTTWHDNEPLEAVFTYSKRLAHHPVLDLEKTVIVHIASTSKESDYLSMYIDI